MPIPYLVRTVGASAVHRAAERSWMNITRCGARRMPGVTLEPAHRPIPASLRPVVQRAAKQAGGRCLEN
jgi:hypothetical protein